MEFYFGAVESELAQARLKRREFRHAELALRLRTSWTKEPFRTAVLMRLAEIDLAADEVSAARLRRLREIDGQRRAELDRERAAAGIEEERDRLEEAVRGFREFLDLLDRVIELVPDEE